MMLSLARLTCALALTTVARGQPLLDRLTLRIEATAQPSALRLEGVLPPELLESIAAGDPDLRHLITYDAPARRLHVRTFLVPASSPPPTSFLVVGNTEVEGFMVDVTHISLNEAARSLSIEGAVATGASPVHAAFPGDTFRLTTRFEATGGGFERTDIHLSSGTRMLLSDGAGAVVVEAVGNRAPVADAGPEVVESFMTEVYLDALRSYDPDGEPLDYKWHVIGGAATLRGCETPTPTLQLVQGQGVYDVRLTVTDLRGAVSYDYLRIRYVGR
jgi:hypothetical protein